MFFDIIPGYFMFLFLKRLEKKGICFSFFKKGIVKTSKISPDNKKISLICTRFMLGLWKKFLKPQARFELATSSLPRTRSTG